MEPTYVQTKRDIKGLLAAAGIRPRKRYGQHFLIDGNGLTDLLLDQAGRVLCVEIDRGLHSILADRFREVAGVTLIFGDVLESKHRLRREVGDAIRAHEGEKGGPVKLVANLPYQVATPLVMNLLVDYPQVRRLCFTVQAEVGDRITAPAGGKEYGPLSIISQMLATIETVARIPPPAFWPRPAVESVMIRMDVHDSPLSGADELRDFATLVRMVFGHRRKTLRSALGYAADRTARDRVDQAFDGTRRPESFSIEEWIEIFGFVQASSD